eukprot:TRINITY_DN999_c0_g1_i17.p1 TRINITY_DN999_c0_g1~~TRINITY_DN999_c0_g1_i17.p1  ORF type:complete len:561 (-),score=74.11 TRINITY_DN999_c0_g1_i17:573-2255(-)
MTIVINRRTPKEITPSRKRTRKTQQTRDCSVALFFHRTLYKFQYQSLKRPRRHEVFPFPDPIHRMRCTKLEEAVEKLTACSNPFTSEMASLVNKLKEKPPDSDTMAEIYRQYLYIADGIEQFKSFILCPEEKIEKSPAENTTYNTRIKTLEENTKTIQNDVEQNNKKSVTALKTIQRALNEDLNIPIKLEGIDSEAVVKHPHKGIRGGRKEPLMKLLEPTGKPIGDRVREVEEVVNALNGELHNSVKKDELEQVRESVENVKLGIGKIIEKVSREIALEFVEESEKKWQTKVKALEEALVENEKRYAEQTTTLGGEIHENMIKVDKIYEELVKACKENQERLANYITASDFAAIKIELADRIGYVDKSLNGQADNVKASLTALEDRVDELEKRLLADPGGFKTIDLTEYHREDEAFNIKPNSSANNELQVTANPIKGTFTADRAVLAKHDLLINDLNLRITDLESAAQRLEPNNIRALITNISELVLRDEKREVDAAMDSLKGSQRQYSDIVEVLREELTKLDEKFKQDINKKLEKKDLCIAKTQLRRKVNYFINQILLD